MGEHEPHGYGAMPVRASMARVRPWVTDGIWIAHESLPMFTPIAGLMPRNGWWRMTENGAVPQDPPPCPVPDVDDYLARHLDVSAPCVLDRPAYRRHATREEATAAALDVDTNRVEALDPVVGRLWSFNQEFVEAASFRQSGWSWRLAPALDQRTGVPSDRAAVLIGVDRKDRPRFVVCSLIPPAPDRPPIDTVDRAAHVAATRELLRMVLAQATGDDATVVSWVTDLPERAVFPSMCGLARMVGVSMLGQDLAADERAVLETSDGNSPGHVDTVMAFITAVTNSDFDGAAELFAATGDDEAVTLLATLVGFAGEMFAHHFGGSLTGLTAAELDQLADHLTAKHLAGEAP